MIIIRVECIFNKASSSPSALGWELSAWLFWAVVQSYCFGWEWFPVSLRWWSYTSLSEEGAQLSVQLVAQSVAGVGDSLRWSFISYAAYIWMDQLIPAKIEKALIIPSYRYEYLCWVFSFWIRFGLASNYFNHCTTLHCTRLRWKLTFGHRNGLKRQECSLQFCGLTHFEIWLAWQPLGYGCSSEAIAVNFIFYTHGTLLDMLACLMVPWQFRVTFFFHLCHPNSSSPSSFINLYFYCLFPHTNSITWRPEEF